VKFSKFHSAFFTYSYWLFSLCKSSQFPLVSLIIYKPGFHVLQCIHQNQVLLLPIGSTWQEILLQLLDQHFVHPWINPLCNKVTEFIYIYI